MWSMTAPKPNPEAKPRKGPFSRRVWNINEPNATQIVSGLNADDNCISA